MAWTRLVESIGALGGVMSSRVGRTNIEAAKDRMSSQNGGTRNLHMLPKEPSKYHEENFPYNEEQDIPYSYYYIESEEF